MRYYGMSSCPNNFIEVSAYLDQEPRRFIYVKRATIDIAAEFVVWFCT
jgi:hypothetical protein